MDPPIDFCLISSESKKSYLFQEDPSVVKVLNLFKICLPYTLLPSRLS
jgi:hypothetical protein